MVEMKNFILAYTQLYLSCSDHSFGVVEVDGSKYPNLASKLWDCNNGDSMIELSFSEFDDLMEMNHIVLPDTVDAFITIYLE